MKARLTFKVVLGSAVAVCMLAFFSSGCGGDESGGGQLAVTDTPSGGGSSGDSGGSSGSEGSQTGVVPDDGNYSFSGPASNFSVSGGTGEKTIRFSIDGWSFYNMSVHNGEFHYQNGINVPGGGEDDSGRGWPNDAFRIWGQFVSTNEAVGNLISIRSGNDAHSFTATKQ